MVLQAAYRQFLAAPNSSNLADNASLYYITTTTVFHGSTAIIKHLGSLRQQVQAKKDEVLGAVESANALAIELNTTLEFLTSGGVYLPALDDNFLVERVVNLSITHFVSFDANGKIAQIRQSWDQGALLKNLEIIGRSGRNWPIRDCAEQAKLISSAVKALGEGASATTGAAAATAGATAATPPVTTTVPIRSRGNSTKRDPHASLELFATREELESTPVAVVSPYAGSRPRQRDITEILGGGPDETPRAVVSPYAGRRPRERSFTDILGDEDDNESVDADGSVRGRSRSPTKAIAPKAGSHKNFQPVRLFEADEAAAAAITAHEDKPKSNMRGYKPNPKRYDHFDLAAGSEAVDAPVPGSPPKPTTAAAKSKHNSLWSFDDFSTPQKPKPSVRVNRHDVRHWGVDKDEPLPETPSAQRKQYVPRPRPDAEAHFEFKDDGPAAEPRPSGRPRGLAHNEGLGLYENNLYKEDGSAPSPEPRALGNITNLKDRSKSFEPHFTLTDDPTTASTEPALGVSDSRKKVVKMMEASWTASIEEPASQKENNPLIPGTNVAVEETDERGISIGGDGMGNKKAGRSWSFGDDTDDIPPAPARKVPGKKLGTAEQPSSFWDY